jgi:hypothetical protein
VLGNDAWQDSRALDPHGSKGPRFEAEKAEDRRGDLGGFDRGGHDPRPDAGAVDDHQDVTVSRIHAAVLGQLGRVGKAV